MKIRSALLSVALVSIALPAYAQDATARALFKEGRELSARGDYAAACRKFEESLKLEAGLGTRFNLADCWEHLGRLASAHQLFSEAAAIAQTTGQGEREQVLRRRAEALSARVPRLLVEVEATSAKLTLKRDGEEVPPEVWGKPQPVDAGSYTIMATAPGRKPWQASVEVKEQAGVVSVRIPDLPPVEPEARVPPVSGEPGSVERTAPATKSASAEAAGLVAPRMDSSDRTRKLTLPVLGLGGFGVGALAFSAVMAFRYQSANEEAEAICPTSRNCSRQDIAEHDRLVDRTATARTLGFAGLAAGVASLGGAAALYLLRSGSPSRASSLEAIPVAGPGAVGASVSGTF